jgi:hypothetical protein
VLLRLWLIKPHKTTSEQMKRNDSERSPDERSEIRGLPLRRNPACCFAHAGYKRDPSSPSLSRPSTSLSERRVGKGAKRRAHVFGVADISH